MKTILGVLILAPVLCYASTNQLEFNYGRGFPRASDDLREAVDQEGPRGPQWSADILHKMSPGLYLGLGGGHFVSADDMSNIFASGASSNQSLKMTSILGLGRIDLGPNPKLTPYAIAGLGWVRTSLAVTSGSQVLVDESNSTLGYALGLGMDLPLTDRLYIGIEGRYQNSIKHTFNTTSAGLAATGQSQVAFSSGAYLFSAKVGIKY